MAMKHKNFTLQQKNEIYDFKQKNPKQSYSEIGKIFGDRYGREICRATVHKICKQITQEKETNGKLATCDMNRRQICPKSIRVFEEDLYGAINSKLLKSLMTFQTVQILGAKLQASEKYKADKAVQTRV